MYDCAYAWQSSICWRFIRIGFLDFFVFSFLKFSNRLCIYGSNGLWSGDTPISDGIFVFRSDRSSLRSNLPLSVVRIQNPFEFDSSQCHIHIVTSVTRIATSVSLQRRATYTTKLVAAYPRPRTSLFTYKHFSKNFLWMKWNKLACLKAKLVQNFDTVTDWLTDTGVKCGATITSWKFKKFHIHEIQFLWLKILSAPACAWTWYRQVIGGTGFSLEQFSAFFFKCNQPWACTLLSSTFICFALLYLRGELKYI